MKVNTEKLRRLVEMILGYYEVSVGVDYMYQSDF